MRPDSDGFWRRFSGIKDEAKAWLLAGNPRNAFDLIEEALQGAGYDVAFELTLDEDIAVLTLTPEGDPDQAIVVDEIAAKKPVLQGWNVNTRRPRKPLADAFAITRHAHDGGIEAPLFEIRRGGEKLEIGAWSCSFENLPNEEALARLFTFLDHALGEDYVMAHVGRVDIDDRLRTRPGLTAMELAARLTH